MTEYTVWGAARKGIRIGVSYQGFSIGTDAITGQPTITLAAPILKIDTGTKEVTDSNNVLSWWGTGVVADGAADVSVAGKGIRTLQSLSALDVPAQYGAATVITVSAYLSGINAANGTLKVDAVLSGPVIPYILPDAPTGLAVTRGSDTVQNLTFTNNADGATGKPYQRLYIERQDDNEAAPWLQVGTLADGSAVAASDPTTAAAHRYKYRVRAWNSTGYSDYSNETDWIVTTPGTPENLSATKSGSTITLTWDAPAGYPDSQKVQHRDPDAVPSTYTVLASDLAADATTYDHTGASLATRHTYKVQAVASSGGVVPVTLVSESAELTVSLLSAPNAPLIELVSATGTVVDAQDTAVTVKITHQPTDATIQLGAKIKWTDNLGASTEVEIGSLSAGTIPAGTLSNAAGPYTIAAATKGGHADYGPYASAVLDTNNRPQATAVSPDDSIETTNTPTLAWGYFDAEATEQAAWSVTLYDDLTNVVLEQATGVGADSEYTVTAAAGLQEEVTYRWSVRVRDGAGLWSEPASALFTIDVVEPPVPVVTGALYLPGTHAVELSAAVAAPDAGENPAAELRAYRVQDGELYLLGKAAPEVEGSAFVLAVVDAIPPLGATVTYRVQAVTADGGVSNVEVEVETPLPGGAVLNGGPGYLLHAYTQDRNTVASGASRTRALEFYEDRPLPVAYWGQSITEDVRVAGLVDTFDGSGVVGGHWQPFLDLAELATPLCYRDLFGRRWFGVIDLTDVSTDADDGQVTSVAFTFTRTDDHE